MTENFEAKLNEYAHLLVEIGMNVQPGQTPRIAGSIDCAPLIRLCAQAALDLGARDVIVDWTDDFVTRQRYLKADAQVFSEFPSYMQEKFDYMTAHSNPVLSIDSSDPQLLQGVDPQRIQAWRRVSGNSLRAYYDAMTAGKFQWSIGAYPTAAWAQKVFPEQSAADAVDALWNAIFATCRISGDGTAVARWREHVDTCARRCKTLNDYNFQALHYQNALGTDLTVTLPENHIWQGGSERNVDGVEFVANMPTEEVFTAPQWNGVNGRVYAALPLAMDGNLIENFYLDFKDGKIVDVHAEAGEEYLRAATQVDEGASYLGEVAWSPMIPLSATPDCCSTTPCLMKTPPAILPLVPLIPTASRAAKSWMLRRKRRWDSTSPLPTWISWWAPRTFPSPALPTTAKKFPCLLTATLHSKHEKEGHRFVLCPSFFDFVMPRFLPSLPALLPAGICCVFPHKVHIRQ